jgi:hypothetical protein
MNVSTGTRVLRLGLLSVTNLGINNDMFADFNFWHLFCGLLRFKEVALWELAWEVVDKGSFSIFSWCALCLCGEKWSLSTPNPSDRFLVKEF